ncbi:MAG: sugar phosphate isomerase/epimerase [Blastocatellia bacterium]
MQIALNGATTMRADLETDIRAASKARFDWLEIWASKLRTFLESRTTTDLNTLFGRQNLKPYSINSIERITFRNAGEHLSLLAECDSMCSVASELNCPFVVVVPSPLPTGVSSSEVVEQSTRVLDELGAIAEKRGVGLAFEFLGRADCSVRTLALADEIVKRVDRQNVGLVIDSFHFYAGGSTIGSIASLDPDRIFIFHINDAENLPREQLEDRHRLLPGLGTLPLKEIISALKSIGYDRVASVEIFRPEYWERDPFELASEARAAAERALDS